MQICNVMCGICGIISWSVPPSEELVEHMCTAMRHRGPDAQGIKSFAAACLGHRRLSIIDLSETANQPMQDDSGRYSLIFNGEIYNYKELREQLEQSGAVFATNSDTEVILEAYKCWGIECLQRFNGMFAFAIWDNIARTIFLARDRLGQKPLYLFRTSDAGLCFASELKALEVHPEVSRELSSRGLIHYLSLGYILTSESAIPGVVKLPPAHYLLLKEGDSLDPIPYWNLANAFVSKRSFSSEDEAAEALLEVIDDAVRLRLISDVPLGAFLSGGIDSSTIAAAMCRLRPPKENLTFSIGFNEESFSEMEEARETARFLGVTHRDKVVESSMVDQLSSIAYYLDEPFADTSVLPMHYLSHFARQHVTVSLSGDGADELFAGYDTYIADRLRNYIGWLPSTIVRGIRNTYTHLTPRNFGKVSTDYKIRQFLAGLSLPAMDAHYSWRVIFNQAELKTLLKPDFHGLISQASPINDFRKFSQQPGSNLEDIDRAMYVDLKTWLPDDILVKVDRTTMAHSLEARAPFLDYRVVEFAASLPLSLKLKGFQKKFLLKLSQRNSLPIPVLKRKKSGFNAPIAAWVNSSLDSYCKNLIESKSLSNYLNVDIIQNLIDQHRNRKADNSFKLFTLIGLNLWLNRRKRNI